MNSAELLRLDVLKNISLIYFSESYSTSLEYEDDAFILRGKSDRPWTYISCMNPDGLKSALKRLTPADKAFAAIEEWMCPLLMAGRKIIWKLDCERLFYPHKTMWQQQAPLSSLVPENASYIFEQSDYKDILTLPYVKERIENGCSSCISEDGKLIGWAMTQDDGSMGFLHVLPEFRGKGIALHLTLDLMQKVIGRGRIPFVQIERSNSTSLKLAEKTGFVTDRRLFWFDTE